VTTRDVAPRSARWAGLLVALAGVLHLPSLLRPLIDLDEGSYAAMACRLLAGGDVYRDAVENKLPGVFYVYKAVFAVFGRYDMVAIHVVVTLVAIATAFVVGAVARRSAGELAGRWAAALYIIYSAAYYPKMLAGNTEMFAVLPGALTVWCYLRARDGRSLAWLVAAGAAGALALMCKQVALASFAAVCADRAFSALRGTGRGEPVRALRDLALLASGFAAVCAGVVLHLRAIGVWDDAVFWTWTYVFHYYMPAGGAGGGFVTNLATSFLPFLACASPMVVLALRGRRDVPSVVYWWLAGNVAASLVGGRMYGHYFLLFVPALATFAGIGAPTLAAAQRRWLTRGLGVMAAGFFAFAVLLEVPTDSVWSPSPDYREAADYVAARTNRDDQIFVWGWFPALYVAADRCPSTRFVYTHIHSGNSTTVGDLGHSVPEAWDMLMADLEAAPPAFVLDTSPGQYTDYAFPPEHYERLWRFLAAHYTVDTTIAGVRIFRRATGR
jgi:hypothetical protein